MGWDEFYCVLCDDVMCDVLCVVFYCNGMNVSDLILIVIHHRHCVYCANGWTDEWMDTCGGCENIRIYKFHITQKDMVFVDTDIINPSPILYHII